MKLRSNTLASTILFAMALTRSAFKAGSDAVRLATALKSTGRVRKARPSSLTNKRSVKAKFQESKTGTKKAKTQQSMKKCKLNPEAIFQLPDDLVVGTLQCRPSKRNRSPYVADIVLEGEERVALAHVPNLDMGGKCVPGAKLLLKPARDKKGNLVGKLTLGRNFCNGTSWNPNFIFILILKDLTLSIQNMELPNVSSMRSSYMSMNLNLVMSRAG